MRQERERQRQQGAVGDFAGRVHDLGVPAVAEAEFVVTFGSLGWGVLDHLEQRHDPAEFVADRDLGVPSEGCEHADQVVAVGVDAQVVPRLGRRADAVEVESDGLSGVDRAALARVGPAPSPPVGTTREANPYLDLERCVVVPGIQRRQLRLGHQRAQHRALACAVAADEHRQWRHVELGVPEAAVVHEFDRSDHRRSITRRSGDRFHQRDADSP